MIHRLQDKLLHIVDWEYRHDAHYKEEELSQKKLSKILDAIKKNSENNVFIATKDIDNLRERLSIVKAGGGILVNELDELLMIYRNGHWDLPKGKKDKGEKIKQTAHREVEEETGVHNITVGKKAATTFHWYHRGDWLLKETYWYHMFAKKQKTKPEEKEGITKAKWLSQAEVRSYIPQMYPNIVQLVEDYYLD